MFPSSIFTAYFLYVFIRQSVLERIPSFFANLFETLRRRFVGSQTTLEKSILPSPETGRISIVSLTETYIEKQTKAFLKTYEPRGETVIDYNSNIDPVFYRKRELTEFLKDTQNPLEPKWRAKMLFENTPRGNIMMFYDAYKQGFAYYSDQNSIPYALLNAVSMKYVIVFRCRDFFMDETVLPPEFPSGIIQSYEEEERAEKNRRENEKRESEEPESGVVGAKVELSKRPAVFAKFKSYNTVSTKANGTGGMKSSENREKKTKEQELISPKRTNSHISMGKISNFSLLQKDTKQSEEFESPLLDKKRMTYADYKLSMQKTDR